jgi:ElaB/YqjD/DUF883 family membrane-anchored ribosome-binding protein
LRQQRKAGTLPFLLICLNYLKECNVSEMSEVTKDKLVTDLKLVIMDTEELLRATAGQAGDKIADLRVKAQDHLTAAKIKLAEAESKVVDKAKAVGRATDDFVHDNPWRAVGIAAGVGLIAGLLISRR